MLNRIFYLEDLLGPIGSREPSFTMSFGLDRKGPDPIIVVDTQSKSPEFSPQIKHVLIIV